MYFLVVVLFLISADCFLSLRTVFISTDNRIIGFLSTGFWDLKDMAQVTKAVLSSMSQRHSEEYPDMTGIIHYNYLDADTAFHQPYNIFYDAGNFIRNYATPSEYQQWKCALDQAVVEKYFAKSWKTLKKWRVCFTDFEMTEEKYHGVSIFIPQAPTVKHGEYYHKLNSEIVQMQWYRAVGE